MEKIRLSFEVSKLAADLLLKIHQAGSAEYRDNEWKTLEDFKSSDQSHRSDQWFLSRNFGGTYWLLDELLQYGLVESDGESWHLTYVLTDFGREIVGKLPVEIRESRINSVLG